jgi:2-keto-4-pentenoate hydratase
VSSEVNIDARPDVDARMRAGLRTQAEARRQASADGAARLGWKAGYGTAAAMAKLGTSGPLVGFLTDRTRVASGSEVDLTGWRKPSLEAEVAVRFDAVVDGPDEAAAAIGAVAAAIELVDLDPTGDVEAELAGNIFHRHVVLGEFAPLDTPADLATLRVDVLRDGSPLEVGVDPEALLGNLSQVATAVAGVMPAVADRLEPGDVLITGSVIVPVPLEPGQHYQVRLGGSHADVTLRRDAS